MIIKAYNSTLSCIVKCIRFLLMLDKKILGDLKCGRGPVLDRAPAVHRKLYDIIEETAKKEGLQLQYAASSRVTGTDTDAFAYSNGGVISALLSFPLKYMHTTVETVAKSDVEETIQLIYLHDH